MDSSAEMLVFCSYIIKKSVTNVTPYRGGEGVKSEVHQNVSLAI